MVNIIVQLVLKFKSNLDFFVTFSKQSEHSRLYCVYIFKKGCHLEAPITIETYGSPYEF